MSNKRIKDIPAKSLEDLVKENKTENNNFPHINDREKVDSKS